MSGIQKAPDYLRPTEAWWTLNYICPLDTCQFNDCLIEDTRDYIVAILVFLSSLHQIHNSEDVVEFTACKLFTVPKV